MLCQVLPGRQSGHLFEHPVEVYHIVESYLESGFRDTFGMLIDKHLASLLDPYLVQKTNISFHTMFLEELAERSRCHMHDRRYIFHSYIFMKMIESVFVNFADPHTIPIRISQITNT